MVGHIQDMIVDKGDSGSFVFDKKARFSVCLLEQLGTEVVTDGNRSVFISGIFIGIADVLRWCYRVTGEEVKIVHAVIERRLWLCVPALLFSKQVLGK